MSEAPAPYEIATILSPRFVFHPNVSAAGALCLGHPPPGLPLGEILHMVWAALVFNLRVVNTTEWQGFQPEAAVYVRANRQRSSARSTTCRVPSRCASSLA